MCALLHVILTFIVTKFHFSRLLVVHELQSLETLIGVYYVKYETSRQLINILCHSRPPLWSSSWLQIQKPGFNSRHYQKNKVVGLERGLLSLVSTTEELLDRKVAAPV
jgi:hypothetical protein